MSGPAGRRPGAAVATPPITRVAIPRGNGDFTVVDVEGADFREFSDRLTAVVSEALDKKAAATPRVALREVIDNLIHAVPCSVSVVVDPELSRVFISDTGPGISRIDLAFEPGYSTAQASHRSYIRGVGLGLFLAREELRSRGGELHIDTDPGKGTYVQVLLVSPSAPPAREGGEAGPALTQRQNNILFLLSEGEPLGPSRVSSELNIGVSTAHRDLTKLQGLGLIYLDAAGKRFLSDEGRSYLQSLLSL